MKKIFFIIVVICIGFLGCNSKKSDPGSIVKNFYNYLNNGEIEKAKECASPSAKEFIDKLSKLNAFSAKADTIPLELMEIKKTEEPKEGDTAVVNYKIGDFKSAISLLWSDNKWQIIFNDKLKELKIIECNSIEFYKSYKQNKSLFLENYNGCRIRLKNLLFYSWANKYLAIPFDPSKMTCLQPNVGYGPRGFNERNQLYLCDKPITTSGIDGVRSAAIVDLIIIESFATEKEKDNLYGQIRTNKRSENGQDEISIYNFQCSFDLDGIFNGTSSDDVLKFDNCKVLNVKKCPNATNTNNNSVSTEKVNNNTNTSSSRKKPARKPRK